VLISIPVTVKSRVTEKLRAELGAETQKALREVEQELDKIEAEISARKSLSSSAAGKEILALERKKTDFLARRESLLTRLREVAKLRDGQEVTRGQVQGFYHLRVGDMWPLPGVSEIVLEDGRVVAMREGRSVTVSLPLEEEPRRETE